MTQVVSSTHGQTKTLIVARTVNLADLQVELPHL